MRPSNLSPLLGLLDLLYVSFNLSCSTLTARICFSLALVHMCTSCQRQKIPLAKRRGGITNGHSLYHPLLRIGDTSQVDEIALITSRLERQLQDLNSTIFALCQKVGMQLGTSRTRKPELSRSSFGQQLGTTLIDRDTEFVVPSASKIQEKIARSKTTAAFNSKWKKREDAGLQANRVGVLGPIRNPG